MSQLESQKYQIAWFKLSEFVRRGEKERALGIYKLLMHTVDDAAFAKQLEGDLLLFFNDEGAIQSYITAAQMYKKSNKLAQAVAIYEHLVAQFPHEYDLVCALVEHYLELGHPTRITLSLQRLIVPLMQVHSLAHLLRVVNDVSVALEPHDQALLYVQVIQAAVAHKKDDRALVQPIIDRIAPVLSADERDQLRVAIAEYTNSYIVPD